MLSKEKKQILIIGAGPSGMTAALSAAREGCACFVVEHNDAAGKKLALTGNGRCNYTNTDISPVHYHQGSGEDGFIKKLLEAFSYEDCISFFEGIGIEPEIKRYRFDDHGYVYPEGENAAAFRDRLYGACLEEGVVFKFGLGGEDIGLEYKDISDGQPDQPGHSGRSGRRFTSRLGDFDACIIATGSNAYPMTGSDNSIYPVLMHFGIKFNRFYPALCALFSKDEHLRELKGRRIETGVVLKIDGEPVMEERGEIQFNEHSISGIPVMQLSGYAAIMLSQGRKCSLMIDGREYPVHRTAGFDRSQCCSGGVDLDWICPETMESRSVKGLYFCGDILDVYGDCGGFNLHLSFASGYTAGKSAAE